MLADLIDLVVQMQRDAGQPEVALHRRDGEPTVVLEGKRIYFGTGSDCPHLIDPFSGERRIFTKEDVGRAALLCDGLENIDGGIPQAGDRIQVNSTGYPKSGDYFSYLWKNFITVANSWGPPANDWADQIAAFGYWEAIAGKVFNMNWRLPNFHENNQDIEMLERLTTNLIEWLASESAFVATPII